MDHSQMDHSGHMGHGGDGMDDMCSMSMLFTWDTTNLCIVFKQWHIRSTPGLIASLIAVVLIAMGYEGLRATCRVYERKPSLPPRKDAHEETVTETTPFLRPGQNRDHLTRHSHLIKSLLYGFQNFYAFMLMLVFMTYNGWVMVAVSLGAFLGYYVFGNHTSATKETACH
ncbi:Ctr copper transporter family protein [Cordyceps fumosorosea ARSEF 2679]|uniref:Copper transport protein n=1 Tax=Cordyceps fumosorosea (strain ARSEF 2679) TaxID=1081104 RepID=A0A168ENT3_CORFA|nr:Ctr copper transporter family protein [Cordyceps fumosorosea ARSEF 2679]OAA74036.1 Ctr copper transporter family protein [Cordyceps fumosorosea ARSEF 2679]